MHTHCHVILQQIPGFLFSPRSEAWTQGAFKLPRADTMAFRPTWSPKCRRKRCLVSELFGGVHKRNIWKFDDGE